jgi:dolichol-phosphate mannosyltransferase
MAEVISIITSQALMHFLPLAPSYRMPASPGRSLVAVATYNEIENLPALVDAVLAALPAADILVVDDASPDGTGAWCEEHSRLDPRLTCIRRTSERGLGSATIAALCYAIEHEYEFVLTMDADFSHPPESLPTLRAAAESADVVIGSRYVAGGAIEGWPLARRVVSRTINAASRFLAGLRPRDCSGAFRCYRVQALLRIDFAAIQSGGFAFLEEILWHLQRSGAKIVEVPITFQERQAGRSKASLGEALGKLKTLCRLALLRVR